MTESSNGNSTQHAAWLVEISECWQHFNWEYLRSSMDAPGFKISLGTSQLGSWDSQNRIISISERHILRDPWLGVMETLRHEMAHQYVDEILRASDEAPHGPAFKKACLLLRVSPSVTGTGGEVTPLVPGDSDGDDAIREKISKLLSLATSPNKNEAQSAMNKARQLLLKYNLSAQDIHAEQTTYALRQLGESKARRQRYEYTLANILNQFFFVEIIWSPVYDPRRLKSGHALLVYGTCMNLDMAEYVFSFLNGILGRLWAEHQQGNRIVSNKERLHFYWGVLSGFYEKLNEQNQVLSEQQALVWKGDPGLRQFYRYMNPRIKTGSRSAIAVHESYEQGRLKGKAITLHKPVQQGSNGTRGLLT